MIPCCLTHSCHCHFCQRILCSPLNSQSYISYKSIYTFKTTSKRKGKTKKFQLNSKFAEKIRKITTDYLSNGYVLSYLDYFRTEASCKSCQMVLFNWNCFLVFFFFLCYISLSKLAQRNVTRWMVFVIFFGCRAKSFSDIHKRKTTRRSFSDREVIMQVKKQESKL